MKGYQLLGQSEGIDSRTAKEFCRWAPSHGALGSSPDAWGLSFFPLSDDSFAIARTMHGGPEYSGRGGMAVVTRALVVSRRQLAEFENDPIALARTALALGHLIFPASIPKVLGEIVIPNRSLPFDLPESDFADRTEPLLPPHAVRWVARESASLLKSQAQVMICGPCDPLPILFLLFDLLDADQRSGISFACGLKRTARREYRIQFTDEKLDAALQRQLTLQSITPIDLNRVLVS